MTETETVETVTRMTPLRLDTLQAWAHRTAQLKGWHDEPRTVGDAIALMHSELSEALEAYRENGMAPWYEDAADPEAPAKPCGVASELADTVIRILDFCGEMKINLNAAVFEKMEYNETRAFRHGGKKL